MATSSAAAAAAAVDDALKAQQLEVLLTPPTADAESAYFARLTSPGTPGHGNVVVKRGGGGGGGGGGGDGGDGDGADAAIHGKGLFAARDFAEGERVLVEPPLIGMQQESTRDDALVCAQCFTYVGSVEQQIARRLLTDAAAGDDGSGGGGGGDDSGDAIVDPAFLRQLLSGEKRLPGSESFPMPACRKCPGG